MKYEDYTKLESGNETDALIAELILDKKTIRPTMKKSAMVGGCRVCSGIFINTGRVSDWGFVAEHIPSYSRDDIQALSVLEGVYQYRIEKNQSGYVVYSWMNEYGGARKGEDKHLAMAICKSLLRWHIE